LALRELVEIACQCEIGLTIRRRQLAAGTLLHPRDSRNRSGCLENQLRRH
jgi:hypothetical protein